jgi:quercetin dioxygenase-like cupin family protein
MSGMRSNEEALRARLASEGLVASSWGNGPGDRYAEHRHDYDKVLVAAAGSIQFALPELGRTVELVAGDRLELPAGTLHAARVGPAGVMCLEAHVPRGSLASEPVHRPVWGDALPPATVDETAAARGA